MPQQYLTLFNHWKHLSPLFHQRPTSRIPMLSVWCDRERQSLWLQNRCAYCIGEDLLLFTTCHERHLIRVNPSSRLLYIRVVGQIEVPNLSGTPTNATSSRFPRFLHSCRGISRRFQVFQNLSSLPSRQRVRTQYTVHGSLMQLGLAPV